MTDALAALIATVIIAMVGAVFLSAVTSIGYWPAVAGCWFLFVILTAIRK